MFAWTFDEMLVLDGTSLLLLARLPISKVAGVAFERDTPRAFVLSTTVLDATHFGSRISLIDTDRLTIDAQTDLPARSRGIGLAIAPRPPRPTNLTAIVSGAQVSLEWQSGTGVGAATNYIFEVGFTRSATALTFTVPSAAAHYSVSGVPSGTYYVRVRAANSAATSAPSNEVAVIVP